MPPTTDAGPPTSKILVRLPDRSRRVVDTKDIYLLEADDGDTLVRLRHKEPLRDVRRLHEVADALAVHGIVRIHQSWAVQPERIREIRPQRDGRDWEVVMDPPVNRVLPVARARLAALFATFGEEG